VEARRRTRSTRAVRPLARSAMRRSTVHSTGPGGGRRLDRRSRRCGRSGRFGNARNILRQQTLGAVSRARMYAKSAMPPPEMGAGCGAVKTWTAPCFSATKLGCGHLAGGAQAEAMHGGGRPSSTSASTSGLFGFRRQYPLYAMYQWAGDV